MVANWQPKPIYCPRRHGIECDTPNACAGGAVCRFGPDPATQRLSPTNSRCRLSDLEGQEKRPHVSRTARQDISGSHRPLSENEASNFQRSSSAVYSWHLNYD